MRYARSVFRTHKRHSKGIGEPPQKTGKEYSRLKEQHEQRTVRQWIREMESGNQKVGAVHHDKCIQVDRGKAGAWKGNQNPNPKRLHWPC